jgi:uncharacterized protein (TIGR02118 family)
MFKVMVLYNLAEHMDQAEFEAWRLGTHQAENAAEPGVIRTDFSIASPQRDGTPPRYRYITELWFETREDMERSFYSESTQAQLSDTVDGFPDRIVLLAEEMAVTENPRP